MAGRWARYGLLGMALGLGCGGAPAREPSSPRPIAGIGEPPGGEPETEDDLRLVLLDPGSAPRAPLRYRFHIGQQEQLVMDLDMHMTMAMPGKDKVAVALPTMESGFSLMAKELTKDGDLRYEFLTGRVELLDDPNAKPELVAKLRSELKSLEGLKGEAIVTNRGLTRKAQFDIPTKVAPQVRQTIENMGQVLRQLATPFPREDVGVGAKWKTTSTVKTKSLKMTQIATYSLVSNGSDRASIDVEVEQQAPPQVMKLDGVPPEATTTLDSLKTHGTGHLALNPDRMVPLSSESEVETQTRVSAEMSGQKATFENGLHVKMKLRPK